MTVCFGVISIGQLYTKEFNELFRPSLVEYTAKYGYDLKVFTEPLDPAQKHTDAISFQKCLVPGMLADYEWVVVLDADVYIEKDAPPISDLFASLGDGVGVVDEICDCLDKPSEYYKKSGFDLETKITLNSGMLICSPAKHGGILKGVYDKYISKCVGHPLKFHYEQSCVGFELQNQNMFTLVPASWNFIHLHTSSEIPCYFRHVAGVRKNKKTILAVHLAKSLGGRRVN